MADESWGKPSQRVYARRHIREIRYENVVVHVNGQVVEIFTEFFRDMSKAFVAFPPGAVGYMPGGEEYEIRGLSVLLPGVKWTPALLASAARLGLSLTDTAVEFRGTVSEADAITRKIIEARTTLDDSIESSVIEVTRPGTRGLAEGDSGPDVLFLQLFTMCGDDDGVFSATLTEKVREFQTVRGLEPTGVVDEQFWLAMFPERIVQVGPGDNGMWVRMVQALVIALDYGSTPITSMFGTRTTRDIRSLQQVHRLRVTGFVRGPEWGVLVHRPVTGFPLD